MMADMVMGQQNRMATHDANSQIVDLVPTFSGQQQDSTRESEHAVAKPLTTLLQSSAEEDAEFDRLIQQSIEQALNATDSQMDKEIVEMRIIEELMSDLR